MIGGGNNMFFKSEKNNKGLTLIEILVTVALLSILFSIVSGLFFSALKAQRKSLTLQNTLSQTSFIMEYISRQLRMSQKEDSDLFCLSQDRLNYETSSSRNIQGTNYSGLGIKFITYHDPKQCWEFFLDENDNPPSLKISKDGADPSRLTSENVEVEDFAINFIEEVGGQEVQDRVTFSIKLKGLDEKIEAQSSVRIQTTVSQRYLDVD